MGESGRTFTIIGLLFVAIILFLAYKRSKEIVSTTVIGAKIPDNFECREKLDPETGQTEVVCSVWDQRDDLPLNN